MQASGTWSSWWKRFWRFVTTDVWDIELSALSVRRRFGVNALRVILLVFRGFRQDECPLHAAALTFSSLMSIVPVLALSLALARGLGGEESARSWIRARVSDWTDNFSQAPSPTNAWAQARIPADRAAPRAATPAGLEETRPGDREAVDDHVDPAALAKQINHIVEKGFKKIDNVSFGALGGVGLVVLLWMVIAVLGRVESSFNRVWGVTVDRPLWRKCTDYLSVLFILPLLLLAASSLPAADFVKHHLNPASAQIVHHVLTSGLLKHATVFVMTALAFTFLIKFMPNTRVRWLPGLTGGVVTALCFLLWLWVCASLQVGAARAGKIYGSFATLPILLAWVNVSWQIVFVGAEVAFAVQNCTTYRMEQGAAEASYRSRLLLGLSIVAEVARAMLKGGAPFQVNVYAREKRIPVRFLLGTIDELVKAGLLAEIAGAPGTYTLLRAPETLLVHEVIDGCMRNGVPPGALGLASLPPSVTSALEQADGGIAAALHKTTVRELADKL